MPREPKVYSATLSHREAAEALGGTGPHSQLRVFGAAPSWAAFVRRVVDAGLEWRNDSARDPYARASAALRWNGSQTGNAENIAQALADPDKVFVEPLSGPKGGIPWPPEEASA